MKLENVLKVMAAITALLVAASEVLNQANQYSRTKNGSTTTETTTTENAVA